MKFYFKVDHATFSYFSIMAIAALIALIRGFLVAGMLDVPSFGSYATIVAAGMFTSAIISFGEIEQTLKTYPRLWLTESDRRYVIKHSDKSSKRIIRRVGIVLILMLPCLFVDAISLFVQMGIFVVLVALSAAMASLYTSAIRATGEVELLARNTLLRAVIVIILGLLGAFFFNWQGAIFGEVSGALLGALITRHSIIQQINRCNKDKKFLDQNDNTKIYTSGGLWLFFASLLTLAPVYLDRAYVASVFGATTVGTFGFLMLFVTGANTFTGIIAQKVGPQIVKMEHVGESITAQIKYAFSWLKLIWLVCITGMVCVALLLVLGPAQYFFEKFHLDLNLIAATSALCILQIGVIADFILISRNQERAIFFAACCYLTITVFVVIIVLWLKLSLADFIWLLVLSKFLHIAAQTWFIGSIWFEHKTPCKEVK